MAYGGGTYTTQNKILPGAYINFVSAARATAELSARGTAAMLLPLPFGPQGVVTSLKADYFAEEAPRLFGCSADSDALLPVRELFRGAETRSFTVRRAARRRRAPTPPRNTREPAATRFRL